LSPDPQAKVSTAIKLRMLSARSSVVEDKQAGGGLPFERAVKLQEASEGTDGFFRISKDANLQVQIVETERNAVMVRQRVA
jgi:hypothetical protein